MGSNIDKLVMEAIPLCVDIGDTMSNLLLREMSEGRDLTLTQMKVLRLVEIKGSVKMKDISEKLSIKPSGATYIVDGLIKYDFLERFSDEHDRRVVMVKITEKGSIVAGQFKKDIGNLWSNCLGRFSEEKVGEFLRSVKVIHSIVMEIRKNEELFR